MPEASQSCCCGYDMQLFVFDPFTVYLVSHRESILMLNVYNKNKAVCGAVGQ